MSISKSLNLKDEKWKACKYELEVELRFSDGTVRQLKPVQIGGLYLEKDYDTDHLPVLMLDLSLSPMDRNAIDDTTEFNIRIKQFYTIGDSKEKIEPKMWFNETFVKISQNKGTIDTTTSKLEKKIRESNNVSENDVAMEDLASQTSYPLGKKSDLMLTKVVVNGVLINVNQMDILCYMLSKAGCGKPMVFSNLTNSATIAEHIIHPKNLLYNMLYHEREYGWHQEGTCIFFDYDYLYIIRMNGLCTAWRPNEYKNLCFCISESSSEDNAPQGVLIKQDVVYFNISFDQYNSKDISVSSDQVEGKNMLLVDTSSGGVGGVQASSNSYGSGAYATKEYHGHNPYMQEQHERRKLEQERQFTLTCKNGDIGLLTPNKQISVLTDVTSIANDFNGDYRIGGYRMSLMKSGDFFESTTQITIKRVSK